MNDLKYQQKPVVIEAFQYRGAFTGKDSAQSLPDWAVKALDDGALYFDGTELMVRSPTVQMHASVGDYIMKSTDEGLYVCKQNIFERTYERADVLCCSEGLISRKTEYLYLKAFAFQSDFDEELSRGQLRSLWTAYAFHHELVVDTAEYDNELRELWDSINKNAEAVIGDADWSCYEMFDQYMCQYLV